MIWTDSKLRELRKLAPSHTASELALHFNVSRQGVYNIASKHKIKIGESIKRQKKRIPHVLKELSIAERIMVLRGEKVRPSTLRRTFSDSQLLRYIESIETFAKEVLSISIQPYQRKMIRLMQKHKRVCFVTGRQIGKDFISGLFALWESIVKPNYKTLIISASQRQSDLLMDRVFFFVARSPEIFDSIRNNTQTEVNFLNGSQIVALPAQGLIRGFSEVDRIFLNECRDIPDDCWHSVEPMLAIKGGSLVEMSTPFSTQGRFYRDSINPLYHTLYIPSAWNQYVKRAYLETQRKIMSSPHYRTEFEAQFVDLINQFFPSELVDSCSYDYDMSLNADPQKTYCLGYDPARLRDSGVMIVVSEDSEGQLRVEHAKEFSNRPFSEQLFHLRYLHSKFNFKSIVVDVSGLGLPIAERLEEEGFRNVVKFKSTLANQFEGYDHLKALMENRRLSLPLSCERLLLQLKLLTFEVLPSQQSPRIKGSEGKATDDYADALMLACYGFVKPFVPYGGVTELF